MRTVVAFEFGGGSAVLAPPRTRTDRRTPQQTEGGGPPPHDGGHGGDDGGGGGDGGRGPSDDGPHDEGRESQVKTAELGMELGLLAITSLFLVFLGMFVYMRRTASEWPEGIGSTRGLWVSTLALLASSGTFAVGVKAGRSSRWRKTLGWLAVTLALGLAFIALQARLWFVISERGLLPSTNGYGTIFYSLTGLHVLHILGGVTYLATLIFRLCRKQPHSGLEHSIRLGGTYWHFMGVIWLVLFAVLSIPS